MLVSHVGIQNEFSVANLGFGLVDDAYRLRNDESR
jgi:hypothetical protein